MKFSQISNISIGIDIVSVDRIKKSIKKGKNKFLKKIFTQKEINYCKNKKFPYIHFAGRFAAKESIIKAFSDFNKTLFFKEIEIISNRNPPKVEVLKKEIKKDINFIKLSISHNHNYAVSVCIINQK